MSTNEPYRYYVLDPPGPCFTVNDLHFPNVVIAFCYDEHKADLICGLLNESWDKLTSKKGENEQLLREAK